MTIVRTSLFLMLLLGSITTAAFAQEKSDNTERPIILSDIHPIANETSCGGYFLRSENAEGPRIGFSYVQNGAHSENPRIVDITIVIDDSKKAPTFQELGRDDAKERRMQFLLRMSNDTADREKVCLAGITRK